MAIPEIYSELSHSCLHCKETEKKYWADHPIDPDLAVGPGCTIPEGENRCKQCDDRHKTCLPSPEGMTGDDVDLNLLLRFAEDNQLALANGAFVHAADIRRRIAEAASNLLSCFLAAANGHRRAWGLTASQTAQNAAGTAGTYQQYCVAQLQVAVAILPPPMNDAAQLEERRRGLQLRLPQSNQHFAG